MSTARNHLQKAFTLIELLAVVAILGLLSVGLVTAVDPIEQINRAVDTTTLSLARDFASSANQFQANKGYSVACADSACATYLSGLNSASTVSLSALTAVNTELDAAGTSDSSSNYTSHTQASSIVVSVTNTSPAQNATFVLCWQPKSKIQRASASTTDLSSTIYNNLGVLQSSATCPASTANMCYRCIKQ